jgi:dsDNA-specific endonuclease/ATPase MutS2
MDKDISDLKDNMKKIEEDVSKNADEIRNIKDDVNDITRLNKYNEHK